MITESMRLAMDWILDSKRHPVSDVTEQTGQPVSPISSQYPDAISRWQCANGAGIDPGVAVKMFPKMNCLVLVGERPGSSGRGNTEKAYVVDRVSIAGSPEKPSCCIDCLYGEFNADPCVTARGGIRIDPPSKGVALFDAPEE